MATFRNREEAGVALGDALLHLAGERPLVLGLPRGGVPVALQVAQKLQADVDVLVSRKLGAPGRPELGFGAIAEGGARWVDEEATTLLGLDQAAIDAVAAREGLEVERRVELYRQGRSLRLEGRTVILVDDGVATGGTLHAAIRSARLHGAAKVVAAVPVAAAESAQALRLEVEAWVTLLEPEAFWAVGIWYDDFSQVRDEEVVHALNHVGAALSPQPP